MPYREDLDAAFQRVNAAEEELAEARKASDADHARIAELEQKLAHAQQAEKHEKNKETKTNTAKKEEPPERRPGELSPLGVRLFQGFFVLVALVFVGIVAWGVWRETRPMPKIDVSGALPSAQALARETFPDAVLVSIRARYVDTHGIDDLANSGWVDYDFVSPSQAAKPGAPTTPGLPHDGSNDPLCAVMVSYNRRTKFSPEVSTTRGSGVGCGVPLAHPPSCTAVDVWNEAIRRGAPKDGVATELSLKASAKGEPTWNVDVNPVYNERFPDSCPFTH